MQKIFTKYYPNIDNIFGNYVISDEYSKNPLTVEVNKVSSEAIDKAVELIKRGNELKAADTFVEGVVVHEELGFLLGFSYAMRIAQESMKR